MTKKQNKLECLSLAIHTGLVFLALPSSVHFPIGGTRLERFVRDRPSSLICFFASHKLEILSLEKFFQANLIFVGKSKSLHLRGVTEGLGWQDLLGINIVSYFALWLLEQNKLECLSLA